MRHKKACLLFTRVPALTKNDKHDPFLLVPWNDIDLLYGAMAADVIEKANQLTGVDVILFAHEKDYSADLLPPHGEYRIERQQGKDFDESVAVGIEHAFQNGYQRVLAIFSSHPLISTEILRSAFSQLTHEEECLVYGPLTDGDCYLVGMRSDYGSMFRRNSDKPASSSLLQRLCSLDLMLVGLRALIPLTSGYALMALRKSIDELMRSTADFPRHTAEMFRLIQRKHKLKPLKS